MTNPIRVFCACAPDGLDAESQLVVEHSLVSRASRPVEITWMRLSRDPASPFYSDGGSPGWDTRRWATPFSWFRYAIPELCGFEGRAIYCDSDVMFLADVAELFDAPLPAGKVVMARDFRRLCVSLWDCAEARKCMPPLTTMQRSGPIMRQWGEKRIEPFPAGQNWNCLDGDGLPVGDPSIKCIHFTDIATQPQLPLALRRLAFEGRRHWFEGRAEQHPRPDLVALFDQEFAAGVAAGLTLERYDQEPRYGKIVKRDLTAYRGGPRLAAGAA